MRVIVDYKRLRDFVPYSRVHITRLEDAGRFPKRVKLSENRCGWVLDEVQEWIEQRMKERNANDHS